MKFDLLVEHFLKKLGALRGSGFWITPDSKFVDVYKYDSHAEAAYDLIGDHEDKIDINSEDYASKLRIQGYISAWIEPGDYLHLVSSPRGLKSIKKVRNHLIDTCIEQDIDNVNLDLVDENDNPRKRNNLSLDAFQRFTAAI
tara:strand:- start:48 stop:473 length:426 start_codon:yes stop_codon:yes gene_type:complete